MRSGSRCSPFTPFNAFHGRRYRRRRALSFLLKAGPRRAMTGAKAPRPRPGHRSVLPLRSARRPPATAPVRRRSGHRSGLVVSRRVPLHLAGAGPLPPGSIPALALPSALRPAGRARAGAPSCPSPGSCRSPHEVPARALSRCPLSRQASPLPFPVLRMYEERTPDSPTTFLQVFSRIFPSPPRLVFLHVDDATVASQGR
jgi:hypothetical protein